MASQMLLKAPLKILRLELEIKVVPVMSLHYVSRSPPLIKTLITFSYKFFYKLHLSQKFSLFVVHFILF